MILEYEKAIFGYLREILPDLQRLTYATEEDVLGMQGTVPLEACYYSRNMTEWPLPKLMRIQSDIRDQDDPIRGDIRMVEYYLRIIDYSAIFIIEREQDAQLLANDLRFHFSDFPYVIAHYDLGEEFWPLADQEFKIQLTGIKVETIRHHDNNKGAYRHVTVNWRSWVPMRRHDIKTVMLFRGFIIDVMGEIQVVYPTSWVMFLNRVCYLEWFEETKEWISTGKAIPLDIEIEDPNGNIKIVNILDNKFIDPINLYDYIRLPHEAIEERITAILAQYKDIYKGWQTIYGDPIFTDDTAMCPIPTMATFEWNEYVCAMIYEWGEFTWSDMVCAMHDLHYVIKWDGYECALRAAFDGDIIFSDYICLLGMDNTLPIIIPNPGNPEGGVIRVTPGYERQLAGNTIHLEVVSDPIAIPVGNWIYFWQRRTPGSSTWITVPINLYIINQTTEFKRVAIDNDGYVYDSNIVTIEVVGLINTGIKAATTLEYEKRLNGAVVSTVYKSLLTDVNPPLTSTEYSKLSIQDLDSRAQTLIDSIVEDDYTILNELHKEDQGACPIPIKWLGTWSDEVCQETTLVFEEFICQYVDKVTMFTEIPFENPAFIPQHFFRVLDHVYITGAEGIAYIDYESETIKMTNITSGQFTWVSGPQLDRVWFGGVVDGGLWWADIHNPFEITQTAMTIGTFYGTFAGTIGSQSSYNYSSLFTSSLGGYYFDEEDGTFKIHPYVGTRDFKYVSGWFMYGGTGSNSGLWYKNNRIQLGTVVKSFPTDIGGMMFVLSDSATQTRGGFVYNYDGTLTSTSNTVFMPFTSMAFDRSYTAVYAGGGGALYMSNFTRLTNSPAGAKWIEIADDGYLYCCLDTGIYLVDDRNNNAPIFVRSGNYKESMVAGDRAMYFIESNKIVRMQFNKDFGNTGLGIATKLRRHGGAGQLYNILTGVTPTITVDQLRRLTYEEVLERASKVLELAYLDGVSRVANYPIKDEADLCVIGDVGFSTKSISGFFIGPTQDLGQVTRVVYLPTQYNLAHIAHTWGGTSAIYFTVSYIDNISAWVGGENSISIIRSGYFNNNFNRAGVVGLIELPPEEWDFSLKMEYRYSSTYNVILEKIAQAKHKVNIAATAATIDLSKIYEGPNARTLVMVGNFTVHYNNVANWLDGRIMVNGEVLGKRFYRVAVMQWSNRVYQNSVNTGNAIAKTLLKTIAVNLEYKEYNILNGFPGYPSISEQTYINMTDEEINERADALMTYAAMEEGHPPYKKLNEVIEVDTGLCPINPE